jgi:hypothetical protein
MDGTSQREGAQNNTKFAFEIKQQNKRQTRGDLRYRFFAPTRLHAYFSLALCRRVHAVCVKQMN